MDVVEDQLCSALFSRLFSQENSSEAFEDETLLWKMRGLFGLVIIHHSFAILRTDLGAATPFVAVTRVLGARHVAACRCCCGGPGLLCQVNSRCMVHRLIEVISPRLKLEA